MPARPLTFRIPVPKQSEAKSCGGRGSPAERGYDHKWRKLRERFAKQFPLCVDCRPRAVPLDVVDHIVPVHVAPWLRLDEDNLQGLCHLHHQQKTARDLKLYGRGAP